MANGPPASAAGPSNTRPLVVNPTGASPGQSLAERTTSSTSPIHPFYVPNSQGGSSSNPGIPQNAAQQGYYNYPANSGTWQNGWNYPYTVPSGASSSYQQPQQYLQTSYTHYQPQNYQPHAPSQPKYKPPSPSPSPPAPELHRHWDVVVKDFLTRTGLTQALRGFESDMLVMNSEWERTKVPAALHQLLKDLSQLDKTKANGDDDLEAPLEMITERPLEERKLDYMQLSNGQEPRSQTSINKAISAFLAQNRTRNDMSNRTEFLYSLAEKRRRINEERGTDVNNDDAEVSSCARTDARPIDRDVQMKYDIAKNEEGPLRRTVQMSVTETGGKSLSGARKSRTKRSKGKEKAEEEEVKIPPLSLTRSETDHRVYEDTVERHPGIAQRVVDIETHLSVRYVPSPPKTLLARLKFLEDHLIRLEKDYPPWAALHFNQPNRGWPPPPRPTPIIVPPHLRDHVKPTEKDNAMPVYEPPIVALDTPSGGVKKPRNTASSLHRAVMERLEVQKAMSDLAGGGGDGA